MDEPENAIQPGLLRQRAEDRLNQGKTQDLSAKSAQETQRLLHELQVHQIELEMQNEQLRSAQAEVECGLARYTDLYEFSPVGYFTVAKDGTIGQTNLAGSILLGQDRAVLAGQRFDRFVAPCDQARLHMQMHLVFSRQAHLAISVDLAVAGAQPCTVQINAALLPDGQACRVSAVDITDRMLLEKARLRASEMEVDREAANAASQAKSAFLSRMSHELRTPLNAILGFAQLLESDAKRPLDEHQRQRLQAIQEAGWHLLHMIEEVLDLSRIEAGGIEVNNGPVDVQTVLDEALQMISPVLTNSGLTLHCSQEPASNAVVNVLADKLRLTQVLVNLLTNAIKYNEPGGTVHVTVCATRNQRPCVTVADTGRGMSTAQMAHLFEPFNRLGQENSSIPGTGIGLVITKRLVELMGGTLEVQSEPGVGSRFRVWLTPAP